MKSQFEIEESLKIINHVLYEVSNSYGLVYGNYVKEMISKSKDPAYKVNYDKINVYFSTIPGVNIFKEILMNDYPLSIVKNDIVEVIVHGTKITTLLVTTKSPAIDYDVDQLFYDGYRKEYTINIDGAEYSTYVTNNVVLKKCFDNIVSKKATLLDNGFNKLMMGYDHHFKTDQDCIELNVLNEFIHNGWTICYKNVIITELISYDWITIHFVPLRQKAIKKTFDDLYVGLHTQEVQCFESMLIELKEKGIYETTIEKFLRDNPSIRSQLMTFYKK